MLRPIPLRALVLVVVIALFAAACAGGADTSTTVVAEPGVVDSSDGTVPLPSGLIIDEDPNSPIAATLTFDPGDHPIERIDYLGPKPSSNLPPTAALVYLDGFDDALLIDFDASGSPSVMHLGDVGELRFEIGASDVTFSYIAPDGSVSVETVPLAVEAEAPEAMSDPGTFATGLRVGHFDATVEVNRAVFTHVSVSSTGAPLPPYLSAPYFRIAGCHASRGNATFTCNRHPGQVVESHEFLRTYRLTMTHAATAVAQGVDPSIWPSAQACEAALGNDWWINEPLGIGLGTSATAVGSGLLEWLAANPQAAVVGEGFLPAIALSAAVTIGFYVGKRAASEYLMGSETDCENIKRRVVALNMLGGAVEDMDFTVEVCLPPADGWTFDHECQDIGPYRPFSSALATTVGDAASLDRNRLAPVEFVATADPGVVTGMVTDAETGEPIAGATVSLSEPGFVTTTGSGGAFTLADVPAGPHGLSTTAEGFEETTQPIHVETGETSEIAVTLDEAANVLAWDKPRTYVGDGVQTISFAGTIGTCPLPNSSIALTLFPDGRAEAVYNSESPEITVNTVDDVHELVCRNYAPYTVTLEGHHEAGHVVILISTGDLVAFEGDYTAEELVITYRFTREHPDDDVMVQSIVDYAFNLLHQGG